MYGNIFYVQYGWTLYALSSVESGLEVKAALTRHRCITLNNGTSDRHATVIIVTAQCRSDDFMEYSWVSCYYICCIYMFIIILFADECVG